MCEDDDSTSTRIFDICNLPTLQFLGGTSQVYFIDMKLFCQTGIRQIAATMILENLEKQNDLSPWRKILPQYRLLRSKCIVCLQFNQSWNMCYSPRNNECNFVSTKPLIIFRIHLTEKQNLPFRIILRK